MDYTLVYFWGALIIILVILEAATPQLISIWFAAGAVIALAATLLSAPLWLQIVLFVVVSVILLVATRPLAKKLNRSAEHINADRVVGMSGIVTEPIDNLNAAGMVKVGGQMWSARSDDGSEIPEGTIVTVLRLEGVKVIVTRN